jgi:hypothetical protein
LRYDSNAGVGFAGVGWTLNLPSIVRKGQPSTPQFIDPITGVTGPGLLPDDYYIDGKLLIPVASPNPLPAFLPTGHIFWQLFRAEVDDGALYWRGQVDCQVDTPCSVTGAPPTAPSVTITWLKQTKSGHILQFGNPLDGGPRKRGGCSAIDGTAIHRHRVSQLDLSVESRS